MMALQHSAGADGTSKVIATGSHIFSSYKNQFYPVGEFDVHHNDYFIVRNAMQWMDPILSTPVFPHVKLETPENNAKISGPFTLDWSVSQFHAATYTFDVIVDGTVVTTTTGFSYELNLASGTHKISVKEVSWDGFAFYSEPLTVVVDNDAPTISLTSSSVANGGTSTSDSVSIKYNISDGTGVGVDTFKIFVNGEVKTQGDASNSAGTLDLTGLANGAYNVTATATDTLGNSKSVSYTFTVSVQTTTKSGGAPGFEFVALLAGMATLVVVNHKKRN